MEFSNLRARCKQLQSVCYSKYLNRIEQDLAVNPGSFWRHVSNIRNTGVYPNRMFLNDRVAGNGNGIVDLFADHFASVYADENLNLPDYKAVRQVDINSIEISLSDVFHGINELKLKFSHGPDGIPSSLLKNCLFSLCKPLHHIFSLSLQKSIFPQYFKNSFIVPIFKSGNSEDITNYRGICIQSAIPKLFDKLVSDKLSWHCKNVIIDEQHGFTRGRSTVTNLMVYQDALLNAFESGIQVDAVYTDFSKAFDRVNQRLLIYKLQNMGFGEGVVSWIESYLSGRVQCVRVNNFISKEILVHSGVPQGSHSGPLLFNLFMNDIVDVVSDSRCLLFADDLKIYRSIESSSSCQLLQKDLDNIDRWCKINGLSLNLNKCFCISFGRLRCLKRNRYYLNGSLLEAVTEVRDLGVRLDSQLTFQSHISSMVQLGLRNLGFITRNSADFGPTTFKLLYCSVVRPGLEYASCIWAPFYNNRIMQIEAVQRRFLRTLAFKANMNIRGDNYYINYNLITNNFSINTLEARRSFADAYFLFKLINGVIDCSSLLQCIYFNTIHRTRGSVLFHVPFHSTNYGYYSPVARMCRSLNAINLDPFSISFNVFKKCLISLNTL